MKREFPSLPGVYLFKDKTGRVIYVGKAKSLKNRISSYFAKTVESPKTQALLKSFKSIDYLVTSSELEALLLESRLIKKYEPKYNVQWRDDKAYPYIKLTMNEDWPRLLLSRKKEKDGALYFGPYESRSVKETIRFLTRLFFIRTCKETPMRMRGQTCLQYHIKRCWAPCVGAVSLEQYRKFCETAKELLLGNLKRAVETLKEEMRQASAEHKFEQAAKIRDQIRRLEKMEKVKKPWMPKRQEIRGSTSIFDLKTALKLAVVPYRIEAFDVSNMGGEEVVASMVVFEGGEPKKSDYRKFIIRGVDGQNDVASLHEAVFRRYSKSLKEVLPKPDLVLIDGGIAQANSAQKALREAKTDVPVIGLAKREEEIYFPKRRSPIKLFYDSKALHLLQRIRDEAHRFAAAFHRERRRREGL